MVTSQDMHGSDTSVTFQRKCELAQTVDIGWHLGTQLMSSVLSCVKLWICMCSFAFGPKCSERRNMYT